MNLRPNQVWKRDVGAECYLERVTDSMHSELRGELHEPQTKPSLEAWSEWSVTVVNICLLIRTLRRATPTFVQIKLGSVRMRRVRWRLRKYSSH